MRISLIGFTMLFSFSGNAQVKKLDAATNIQNVTIFSSGARVERSASVNIQTGRSEITFAGLSNQLEQQTVQLKADANITLLSVQSAKDFLTERKIEQEERSFIEKVNTLKDKADLDTRLLDVYKNEEAMLIKNQSIGGQAGVKTGELKEALDFQRQRLTEVYGKELEIQKRLQSEQQDLVRFKAQLQEISRKRDSVSYMVTALVESKETRTVNFQLLYNVKDAGWFPNYDVRVKDVTGPLSVLMNANVFQRSGETWSNIPLLLSTGNPNDNATPPRLQPWMLGFYDPSVSFRRQAKPGLNSGRITDDKNQSVAAGVEVSGYKKQQKESIQTVEAITQFQPTTMVFRIDDKYTLETDGKTTTIGIRQFEIPVDYDYYSAPKADPSAFLTAKIMNWQDYDLQPGEANLYFEGTYLGKTYIDLGSVADTLSLSLGKDNGIKVSRKLVKEFSAKKLIGSSRTETKDYEISVRNTKRVPLHIRIQDQVPVSTDKEISVEDIKAPDAQIDKDTGMVTWAITLSPGQEKKLRTSYSVKYPGDRKVVLE